MATKKTVPSVFGAQPMSASAPNTALGGTVNAADPSPTTTGRAPTPTPVQGQPDYSTANTAVDTSSLSGIANASATPVVGDTPKVVDNTPKATVISTYTDSDGKTWQVMSDGSKVLLDDPLQKNNVSGQQIINDLLSQWGLQGLAATVWGKYKGSEPAAAITDFIRSTPQYAQRFPGMAALNKQGRAINESQYILKETQDIEYMRQYLGNSASQYTDTATLGNLIGNNVSSAELQYRLQAAHDSVLSADPATVQFLKDNYGLSTGDIAAYFLNPDKALVDIQNRANAGQLGGQSVETGFGLNANQADTLANSGVQAGAASRNTFAQLGQEGQFMQALPGDGETGSVTKDQLLNASFLGNATDTQAVDAVAAKRKAIFQEGGQYAATNAGVGGLGSATSGT